MGTQLISFRLTDEEVALLMQHADSEENASSTAQRLIRQLLGTGEASPDELTSLVTQVSEFQEQVESFKSFVDEAIDQRLEAVDRLVNESVKERLKTERLQRRSFEQLEQRLDQYFQDQRESAKLHPSQTQQPERPKKPLNHSQLAKRLINLKTGHPYSHSAITRQKDRKDFSKWSEQRDPEGIAWEYQPKDGLFYPLEPRSKLSTYRRSGIDLEP